MLNQAATDESWGIRDFVMITGENVILRPDCPTLYTECGYQGEAFDLCKSVADLGAAGMNK